VPYDDTIETVGVAAVVADEKSASELGDEPKTTTEGLAGALSAL